MRWFLFFVVLGYFAWRMLIRSDGFLDACLWPIRFIADRMGWFDRQ
jgi:hypothetical protein